jgi:SM-20-related protein
MCSIAALRPRVSCVKVGDLSRHRTSVKLVVQNPDVGDINVKLLLAGGQSVALTLSPADPMLARLLAAVAGDPRAMARVPSWFQIPMQGGRASIAFAVHHIVGVITDPAVIMEAAAAEEPKIPAPAGSQAIAAAPAASQAIAATPAASPAIAAVPSASPAIAAAAAASAAQGYRDVIRHAVVQLDGFLSDSEVAWLMGLTFAAERRFLPSRLSSHTPDYRHSLMLSAPHEVWDLVTAKIRAVMPDVMQGLHIGRFPVGNIDCQLTASIDGSYFKPHTDAGHDRQIRRQLTYVYYFNREPKGFTGGELRIYDDTLRNGKLSSTDSFQVIEPRHNSIVFFQAAIMHEVRPVIMPSKDFRDARFTVNGWVERI